MCVDSTVFSCSCSASCFFLFLSVCQVVGVDDYRMGEEVCACIKVTDGQDCTVEEIKAYCKGQVSHGLICYNEKVLFNSLSSCYDSCS